LHHRLNAVNRNTAITSLSNKQIDDTSNTSTNNNENVNNIDSAQSPLIQENNNNNNNQNLQIKKKKIYFNGYSNTEILILFMIALITSFLLIFNKANCIFNVSRINFKKKEAF
jgi:hypothetical protein